MEQAYSIRESLQGALTDFVRDAGFSCIHLESLIRELVGLLAAYQEEGAALYPEVFVFSTEKGLKALAPSAPQVTIGSFSLTDEDAPAILKNCASLALDGWAIYVVKTSDTRIRYGLFRSSRHTLATSAAESMRDLGKEEPVIVIRNGGHHVVELQVSTNQRYTVSLTTRPAQPSPLEKHIDTFVKAVVSNVGDSIPFADYLRRLLTDLLQRCHGTILAALDVPSDGNPPAGLEDGVWLEPSVKLAALHANASTTQSADALADLQGAQALLRGMINSDGIVLFGADGSVLAYRIFVRPEGDERNHVPDRGGGRKRAFALLQQRLGTVFKSVFFRSQDGETICI